MPRGQAAEMTSIDPRWRVPGPLRRLLRPGFGTAEMAPRAAAPCSRSASRDALPARRRPTVARPVLRGHGEANEGLRRRRLALQRQASAFQAFRSGDRSDVPTPAATALISFLALSACAPARAEPAMWVVQDADSRISCWAPSTCSGPSGVEDAAHRRRARRLRRPHPRAARHGWRSPHRQEVACAGTTPAPLSERLTERSAPSCRGRGHAGHRAAHARVCGPGWPPSPCRSRPWSRRATTPRRASTGCSPRRPGQGKPVAGFETAEQQLRMLAACRRRPSSTSCARRWTTTRRHVEMRPARRRLGQGADRRDRQLWQRRDARRPPCALPDLLAERNADFARKIKAMLTTAPAPAASPWAPATSRAPTASRPAQGPRRGEHERTRGCDRTSPGRYLSPATLVRRGDDSPRRCGARAALLGSAPARAEPACGCQGRRHTIYLIGSIHLLKPGLAGRASAWAG